MPSIYLSFRPGDDGGYVESFSRALREAIDRLDPAGTRMFLGSDDGVVAGVWRESTARALAESTIFVAICSERYLLTERCGREWWSFAERCKQHEAATGRRPRAILPFVWGFEGTPGTAPASRYATGIGWGEDLRALSRLHTHRHRYQELIARVARHIVDESRDPIRRALRILPYRTTPNAFAPAETSDVRPAQEVRFAVVAGRRDQMVSVRDRLEGYGERPDNWQPYGPGQAAPLVVRAQAVAAEHVFHSSVVDAASTADELEAAQRRGHLLVVLVDAWAARLDSYRRILAEIDSHTGSRIAVVVPISTDDPTSVEERDRLAAGAARMFPRRTRRQDPMLWIGPGSAEQFDEALGRILEAARNVSLRTALVRRSGPGPMSGTLPVLEAP